MNSFSDLLNQFIHQKDISVYPMTQYCGIDRILMYKYLNGKEQPLDKSVIDRMADFMRLCPSEYDELLDAWQIEKIGWKKWNSRRQVEKFFVEFPDISRLCDPPSFPSVSALSSVRYPNCLALSTQPVLNNAISRIILEEIQNKDGYLRLILQPDYDYIFHFLGGLGEQACRIPIEHILCLEKTFPAEYSAEAPCSSTLDYLEKILPLYLRAFDYNVYYYYGVTESRFANLNGMTGLILTSTYAIICTADFQEGILYGEPEIINMFRQYFETYRKKCSPLFIPIQSVQDTCSMILNFFSADAEYYSLQPEPCIIPFITQDILVRQIRSDFPDRKKMITLLNDFICQRSNAIFSGKYQIFHTINGIQRFMETGRLHEIPAQLYFPFPPEERKLLLYRLSQFISVKYQFLRGPLEELPQNFHLWVSSANGYLMFTNRRDETVYLFFTESSLLAAFTDYLKNMDKENIYTCNEARHIIEGFLESDF